MSRSKIILLDDRFEKTGEPTVQTVLLWSPLRGKPSWERLTKEACASPALEYIKSIKPTPGRTVVLVIGLGSYEFYGLNRNADGFNEVPYKPGRSNGPGRDSWVMEPECIQHHFHSYEQGHVFRHHVNRDPVRAVGNVLKAFWNPFMHRVEVLEDIDNAKAPDLVEQIADNEFPAKSMGCFCAGTLVLARDGYRPIESLAIDDEVLSDQGHWRRITETHARPYRGTIYGIHTATGTTYATGEHPYAVIPRDHIEEYNTAKGYHRRRLDLHDVLLQREWSHAECLTPGDYLVTPFDTAIEETLTRDQCRLLGYYVAEGHIIFRKGQPYGVEFNHHRDDAATTELPELLARLVPDRPVHQAERTNSAMAQRTVVYDTTLAHLCIQHCGQYAATKRLSEELRHQPKEMQLAFLGAWVNGDGGTVRTGEFYLSTCNQQLAHAAQHLGFRCGLYSQVHSITHQPSTIVDKVTVEHRVSFARSGCNVMSLHTTKVMPRELRSASTGPLLLSNCVVSKIKEISVLAFDGKVYNLEVADDNSYVAENHAVHNCRIQFDVCTECGNMAPTRKHYCDHLKFQLNWLNPKTGIRYGALNPSPRFFDSSWVVRPADRTGYLLQKVAERAYELRSSSELGELVDALEAKSAAAKKLAVIDKVVRGYPASVVSTGTLPEASLIQQYRDTSLPDVVDRTPELGAADIDTLAQHRLPDVLAALSRSGVMLTTPEFLRLFLAKAAPGVQIPEGVLDRAAALQAEVFELLGQHPSLVDDMAPALTDAQPEAVAKISAQLTPILEKRATVGDYLWRRIRPRALIPHDAPPTTDLLDVEDPTTGVTYQTTGGAAFHAQNALDEAHLKRLLGAGALMAGAGKVLTSVPGPSKALALPLAGAGLYLGQTGLQEPASYTTTSGRRVPVITEFAEKQSSVMALVDTLGIEHQLTKQGSQRVRRALRDTRMEHPAHLFLQKQAQLGLQYTHLTLADVLAAQDKLASDGITEEKIDLDKAAALMGALLWPTP